MMRHLYDRPTLRSLGTPDAWQTRARDLCDDGPLLEALTPLLDGTRSTETIYGELLLAGFEIEPILAVLTGLDEAGLIEESPHSALRVLSEPERARYAGQIEALAAFTHSPGAGLSPSPMAGLMAQAALKQSHVVIVGLGMVGSQLVHLLDRCGAGHLIGIPTESPSEHSRPWSGLFSDFTRVEGTEDLSTVLTDRCPQLIIYAPDRFEDGECRRLNDLCLSHSFPLLIYRRKGFDVELGPLVIPRQTACYVCYQLRRSAVLSESEALAAMSDMDPPGLNVPIGAEWLALEVVKLLTGVAEPVTRGRLSRFNVLTGLMTVHPVLKLPRCPACGVHRCRPGRKLWEE